MSISRTESLVATLADEWGVEPRSVGKTVYAEWALALAPVGADLLASAQE
ncbi:hypothetical protein QF026_005693 [Streptomyces aurantiacus]|nr:hypothetical protein [Streptomyces aurantiacus]MDQ0777227.1 hypothetical protein [Streptomyces aurantiacus]